MPAAIAIHVCADVLATEPYCRWTALVASRDTVQTTEKLCRIAGIADQHLLIGGHATRAALAARLHAAAHALHDDGLLVLTFSGHTERGAGPIEATRWCLHDGPIGLAELAAQLARLPRTARVVVIADTCYAAAIKHVALGPQPLLLIGGCQEEQTTLERARSEIIVRLERLLCAGDALGGPGPSVRAIKAALEDDTPDAERPCVWTSSEPWWSAQVFELRSPEQRG
ncbi:MAG TPA: hypothetical protein VH165_12700 [Kofleriaceae bacterium]|nr:hypothetical protein [Kofleriaceae bacterium]